MFIIYRLLVPNNFKTKLFVCLLNAKAQKYYHFSRDNAWNANREVMCRYGSFEPRFAVMLSQGLIYNVTFLYLIRTTRACVGIRSNRYGRSRGSREARLSCRQMISVIRVKQWYKNCPRILLQWLSDQNWEPMNGNKVRDNVGLLA